MGGLFDRLRDSANKLKEQRVPIPITESMLRSLLSSLTIEGVSDLHVAFASDTIIISGKAKKLLMTIPFSITLKPFRAEGRTLFAEVVRFAPGDFEAVKQRVLNHPPVAGYRDGEAWFDLNQLDVVKKVPVGSIRSIEMSGGKLWVKVGL